MGIVGKLMNGVGEFGSKNGRLLLTIGSICGVWVGGTMLALGAVKLYKELQSDDEMETKDKVIKGVADLGPGVAVLGFTTAAIVGNHKLSNEQIAGGIVAAAYAKERASRAKAEKELKESTTKSSEEKTVKTEEPKNESVDISKGDKPLWKEEFTGQFFRADVVDISNAIDRAIAKKTKDAINTNVNNYCKATSLANDFERNGVVTLNDILMELGCEYSEAGTFLKWKLVNNDFPVAFGMKPDEEPELGIDNHGNTYRVLQFCDKTYPHCVDDDDD